MEVSDINPNALDAGQGLTGLPGSILNMTSNAKDLINPANLPVDPGTCKPIYPSQYLKVNTIFNVAHDAGLRTAWSDKHPAYQMFDGPSGTGVHDFFTPEINSLDPRPRGRRLDHRQRGDHAVRRLQGAGDPQRDRRLRPQRDAPCGRARDLRHELPDRLHRAEAAHLGRADRRLPAGRQSPARCWSAR